MLDILGGASLTKGSTIIVRAVIRDVKFSRYIADCKPVFVVSCLPLEVSLILNFSKPFLLHVWSVEQWIMGNLIEILLRRSSERSHELKRKFIFSLKLYCCWIWQTAHWHRHLGFFVTTTALKSNNSNSPKTYIWSSDLRTFAPKNFPCTDFFKTLTDSRKW